MSMNFCWRNFLSNYQDQLKYEPIRESYIYGIFTYSEHDDDR